MKQLLAVVSATIALSACDATAPQTQNTEAVSQTPVATPQSQVRNKPTFANRGFRIQRSDWKNAHFEMPNKQYGNITYFAFTRLALVASAECGVPLDYLYFDRAAAIGRRAIFQDKQAREATAKAQLDAFKQEYGPFDPNDPTLLCRAVERNKADRTLFGALFF
ncbi:hypothetical protein [uncultured Tateyamaria sp.]|uniref:hypothetical protein n=1 Tax=uncultured Tateyamaria sp. TaxID=455651 RepID=UPI002633FE99|nr:hypothetical protein [uncultured Tateyamaria sp.]